MSNTIKERKDMDPQYMWDLSTLYKNDEEWSQAVTEIEERITKISKYQGKLNNAKTIRAFLDEDTQLGRLLSNYFCYASLRNCEDTRQSAGQAMEAKAYAVYTKYAQATSFAQPEILSLDEETLKAIVKDEKLAPETLEKELQNWASMGITESTFNFTYFGTFSSSTLDMVTVIRAFNKLSKENLDVRLVLCGDGDAFNEFNRTHWSIKKVDLISELQELGFQI